MKKSLTLGTVALVLGLSINGAAVFADEPVVTSDNPDQPVSNCLGQEGMNCEPVAADPGDEIGEPATDCIDIEGNLTPGTDCAMPIEVPTECDENTTECITSETKCKEIDGELKCVEIDEFIEEETTEPAEWPMYVSLGALGAAVVVFIVLNLFGGKKK